MDMSTIDPRFVVKGKRGPAVRYAGYLHAAHEAGLQSIATQLLQAPSEANGQVAIVHATAVSDEGEFDGIGEASPLSVTHDQLSCLVRIAETRAKKRALTDMLDGDAVDEPDEMDDDQAPTTSRARARGAGPATLTTRVQPAPAAPAATPPAPPARPAPPAAPAAGHLPGPIATQLQAAATSAQLQGQATGHPLNITQARNRVAELVTSHYGIPLEQVTLDQATQLAGQLAQNAAVAQQRQAERARRAAERAA